MQTENSYAARSGGGLFLLIFSWVCAGWLVWLLVMTADIYLELDTVHMVEGILDRANHPDATEHMGIYGVKFAPLSVFLLSWLASWLPAKAFVVVTNLLTFGAALITLAGMYNAYCREFPPRRLVFALAIVALTPVYGYGAITFHPYVWDLGLFSFALALTRRTSLILRLVIPMRVLSGL